MVPIRKRRAKKPAVNPAGIKATDLVRSVLVGSPVMWVQAVRLNKAQVWYWCSAGEDYKMVFIPLTMLKKLNP